MSLVGKAVKATNRRGDPVVIKSLLIDSIDAKRATHKKEDSEEWKIPSQDSVTKDWNKIQLKWSVLKIQDLKSRWEFDEYLRKCFKIVRQLGMPSSAVQRVPNQEEYHTLSIR